MTPRTKRLLLGVAAVVAVSLGFLLEERVRGVVALTRWQAEMRAKGEELTVAEVLRSAPTNPECLSLNPSEAASRWANVASSTGFPPAMRYLAPGRAQVVWQSDSWRLEGGCGNDWAHFRSSFEKVMPTVDLLCADLTNQPFVVRLDYEQGLATPIPHLGRYKGAAVTLKTATQLALRQRRLDLATDNLLAMAALAALSEGDGLFVGERARHATVAIGVAAVWEALHADGWSDTMLGAVQAAWQRPDFLHGMARALQTERAVGSLVYERGRYSARELSEFMQAVGAPPWGGSDSEKFTDELGWVGEGLHSLVNFGLRCRYWMGFGVWRVAWVEQDQLRYQRLLQQSIEGLRRAAREGWSAGKPSSTILRESSLRDASTLVGAGWQGTRCWVSLTLLPVLEGGPEKATLAEAQRGLAVTALAIKRYQLRYGRLPDRMEAMVPELLRAVPRDWFSDTPLHYRRKPDGSFLLYSVGLDGEDNGGDARPTVAGAEPSFARSYDLVWPQPASAAEVAAFESALP